MAAKISERPRANYMENKDFKIIYEVGHVFYVNIIMKNINFLS